MSNSLLQIAKWSSFIKAVSLIPTPITGEDEDEI